MPEDVRATSLPTQSARRRATIRTRLLAAFLTVVLVTLIVVASVSTYTGYQSGRQRAFELLDAVATFKQTELESWLGTLRTDVGAVLAWENAPQYLAVVLQGPGEGKTYDEAYNGLLQHFQQTINATQRFERLFLLDTEGRVVISTEHSQEGESYYGWTFFRLGLEGAQGHLTWEWGKWWLDSVHPVVDENGAVIGVLVGRANLDRLTATMSERAGLGETGEAYLVSTGRAILTALASGERASYVPNEAAYARLTEERASGWGTYENYAGVPVVGAYRWLPELGTGLVVEQTQAEAFASVRTILLVNGGMIVLAALIAVVASLLAARTIARPLANLADTADQIAAGDLTRVARVEREDEIGALARAFNAMTAQLRQLIGSLEERVAERTRELERRSAQLEAASVVAREAAALLDMRDVLDHTVRLISERFGFYHAGIFLMDEAGEYAVLRAASSEGGQRMLARGHSLRVGAVGIVGFAAGTGRPRIALDVGEDAVFFNNPDLPRTRSEMALPLKVGDQVIGVLDVQSEEPAAFSDEDVAILQTLADQVALAINNARLLQESRQALREVEAAYGEYAAAAWQGLGEMPAFEYDRVGVHPTDPASVPLADSMLDAGGGITVIEPEDGKATLVAPLRLRDRIVGAIALEEMTEERRWTDEEIALVRDVSEQVALALENARLYQMEQRRRRVADTLRETARVVGSTLNVDEVIGRLLDQLERLIPFDAAAIQLIHGDRLELLGRRGFDEEQMRQRGTEGAQVSESSLLTEMLDTGAPIVIADTRVDPRWPYPMTGSGLVAPLVIGQEVIGVLMVENHRPGTYNTEMSQLAGAVAAQAAVAIQNARFYADARRRAEEQEAMARIAAVASSTMDLDEMLARLVGEARDLVDAETAVLLLLDERERILVGSYLAAGGEMTLAPEGWRVSLDAPGFEMSIFARGGAYYNNVGLDDPNIIPAYRPYMEALQVRNFCGVALVARERSIGELYVVNRPGGFGPDQVRLLRAAAGYVSDAIERARLFGETQRRVQDLGMLLDASQLLAGAPMQQEEIAEVVVRQFVAVMGIQEASVSLLEEGGRLRTIADLYVGEGGIGEEESASFHLEDFPLTAHVIESLEPVVIQASDPDADPAEQAYMERYEVTTLAIIPLAVKGQAIGIIELESWDQEHHYTSEDLDLAMTMANQAAVALENARLFAQTEQRAERERLAAEITTKIRASASLETLVQTAAEELARALGVSRVLVRVGLEQSGQVVGTGPLPPDVPVPTAEGEEAAPPQADGVGEGDDANS